MDSDIVKEIKNLYDIRNVNIAQLKAVIEQVGVYISKNNRIIYGGMAIDLALKKAGHKGLYSDNIINDFDYYHFNPINESLDLAEFLQNKFKDDLSEEYKIGAINAFHISSRRVRLGIQAVADISYYPEVFFDNIPTINYKGYTFVHTHFQRIDMHLSLSYLYYGAPLDNYKNRLNKDVKRLLLLDEYYPISEHIIQPINTKNNMLDFYKKADDAFISENTNEIKKLNTMFDAESDFVKQFLKKKDYCLTGKIALYYIYKLVREIDPKTIDNLESLNICKNQIDILELLVDEKECTHSGQKYERIYDLFPECTVDYYTENHYPVIVFQNYGLKLSANKTKYGWLANIHYLACTFLFKYFMLGGDYLLYYKACWTLMNLPKKFHGIHMPISLNGAYYGSQNISITWIINEKQETCRLDGKKFISRPSNNLKVDNILDFYAYKVTGHKTDKFLIKDVMCDID